MILDGLLSEDEASILIGAMDKDHDHRVDTKGHPPEERYPWEGQISFGLWSLRWPDSRESIRRFARIV